MADKFDSFQGQGKLSSSPCMVDEVDPRCVDQQQASDVARWRRAMRKTLRDARKALDSAERQAVARTLMTGLAELIAEHLRGRTDAIVSFYWPIKDEPDLRPLMAEMHAQGVRIALPLVETKAAPLVFREWTPHTKMHRGHWNIPVPPPDAPIVHPDVVLAPLVGWDGDGFRLGYGGGYFDRALDDLSPRPFSIGIGLSTAYLATIFQQPHDISLDVILTEKGVAWRAAR